MIKATRAGARGAGQRQALDGLRGYFGRQAEHLGYARRLASGRQIGSGLVGGRASR